MACAYKEECYNSELLLGSSWCGPDNLYKHFPNLIDFPKVYANESIRYPLLSFTGTVQYPGFLYIIVSIGFYIHEDKVMTTGLIFNIKTNKRVIANDER